MHIQKFKRLFIILSSWPIDHQVKTVQQIYDELTIYVFLAMLKVHISKYVFQILC